MTDIPQGYKDSPLGVIPKEWEVKRLGDIAKITSGTTPLRSNVDYFINGNIPWVKTTDLNNSTLIHTEEFVTEKTLDETSLKILPIGTILVAMYGGYNQIGRTGLLKINATINQALAALFLDIKKADGLFVLNWLNSNVGWWKRYAASSRKDPNITSNDVAKFPILLPPLSEQQKIAEVLSTWDEAIEKQSQLVEKLELRKKGLMQQLLTGRKRLPGFVEEWKKARLGDFTDVVGGGTPDTSNENYWYGNIAWFTPSEIGKNKYVYKSQRYITEEGLNNSSARLLPIGTILFTSRATIGLKAILKMEATTNQGFQSLIVSNSNNTDFFFYLLDILDNVIKRKASGSTFPEISAKSLKNIMISEQNAIAEILSSCDKEISLANRKLNTLRKEKKGLMQVLLTGKKRIV